MLFIHLRQRSNGLFSECLECWQRERDQYLDRANRLEDALYRGLPLPEDLVLVPGDALALVRAVDGYLRDRTTDLWEIGEILTIGEHTVHVVARPFGHGANLSARQPGELVWWLRYFWVMPVVHSLATVEVHASPAQLFRAFSPILEQRTLRIVVGGFLDASAPDWETAPPSYGCSQLHNPDSRWRSVEHALNRAREYDAQVLVLPELTLCPALRARVACWLANNTHSLALVVPGSYHVLDGGRRFNEAWLLGPRGKRLLTHRKLRAMLIVRNPTADNADTDDLDEVVEDIVEVPHLPMLMTPLGPLALAICLDFCNQTMAPLWQAVGPSMVLVPSMSNDATLRAHKRRAADLAREHGTISAIALQSPDEDRLRCYGWVQSPNNHQPVLLEAADDDLCVRCITVELPLPTTNF